MGFIEAQSVGNVVAQSLGFRWLCRMRGQVETCLEIGERPASGTGWSGGGRGPLLVMRHRFDEAPRMGVALCMERMMSGYRSERGVYR